MSEKFPEIDDVETPVDNDAQDFLAREKSALGDEFTTDQDFIAQEGVDEDDEFEDFKSQFPEVGESGDNQVENTEYDEEEEQTPTETIEESNNEPSLPLQFSNLNLEDSAHVQEWKKTRDLEISKRDEAAARKLEDLKKEAESAIDDFYDNYNNKKEDAIAETRKEAEAFIEKKKNFFKDGTTWDRVIQLLDLNKNSNAIDETNLRDKTRFRDLLLALKGKENVPGAST